VSAARTLGCQPRRSIAPETGPVAHCSWSGVRGFSCELPRSGLHHRTFVSRPFHDEIARLVLDPFACERHSSSSPFGIKRYELVVLGLVKVVPCMAAVRVPAGRGPGRWRGLPCAGPGGEPGIVRATARAQCIRATAVSG